MRNTALAERAHDHLRLRLRDDLVVLALQHEHRRGDVVDEVDRAPLAIELGRLGIRADERVLVTTLELVRVAGGERHQVGEAEVRRPGRERVRIGERADRRVAARAGARDEETIRIRSAFLDEVASGVHAVLEIDDAPHPVQPLAIGAAVPGRAAVVDVHHGEAARRPVLHLEGEERSWSSPSAHRGT